MQKRLYRSRTDRMLGGVCGGLGEYLGIDPTFVRIFFFLVFFGGGMGLWIYLLLWILIPEEGVEDPGDFKDRVRSAGNDFVTSVNQPHPKTGLIVGVGLIILGVMWLLENLGIPWLWWWDFDILWPLLLVIAGVALLLRWRR